MKKIDYLQNMLAQLTALVPLMTEYAAEQAAEQAAERAKKSAKVQHSPVLFVSAGQLAAHKDPDSTKSPEGGKYIPARKTAAGLFDTPLYVETQPIVFTQSQLRAAFESQMVGMQYNITKSGKDGYVEKTVSAYWSIVKAVYEELELYGYAALADKPELTEPEVVDLAKKVGMTIDRRVELAVPSYLPTCNVRVTCSLVELLEFAKRLKG